MDDYYNKIISCFVLFFLLRTAVLGQVLEAAFYENLAFRWAPVHYQYVCEQGKDGLKGKSDYLTAVDYDGDWDMNNNWENLPLFVDSLKAHAYYSVVQTKTHWFINYGFFHPRDWSNKFIIKAFDTHENDLEGVLIIVQRPKIYKDTSFGNFRGMITVFHSGFYPFSNGLERNHQRVKPLKMVPIKGQLHPVTCQQSRGHGLKAHPHIQEKKHHYISYYPSLEKAEIPNNSNAKNVHYKLVNILAKGGLWEERNNPNVFIDPKGGFNGTYGGKYKAKPPWVWNSALDGKQFTGGEHATAPVQLYQWYFKVTEEVSENYEMNGYLDRSHP